MIGIEEALQRLRAGNARFVSGASEARTGWDRKLATEARPFAALLGCSDARAPAELVFDVGLGDLFVIRVAGNIVAPSQIGSIELAVELFAIPLVVVMGHTRCGAIAAAARQLEGQPAPENSVLSITGRIAPIIRDVLPDLRAAMRANVRASVQQIAHGSKAIEALAERGKLLVIGAEYELETGQVTFL